MNLCLCLINYKRESAHVCVILWYSKTGTCIICFSVLSDLNFHSHLTIFYLFLHPLPVYSYIEISVPFVTCQIIQVLLYLGNTSAGILFFFKKYVLHMTYSLMHTKLYIMCMTYYFACTTSYLMHRCSTCNY